MPIYIYIYFRLKCCGKIDYKAGEDVTGPTSSVEHDLLFLKTYIYNFNCFHKIYIYIYI